MMLKNITDSSKFLAESTSTVSKRIKYLYFILGSLVLFVYCFGHVLTQNILDWKAVYIVVFAFAVVAGIRYIIDQWFFVQDPMEEIVGKEFFITLCLFALAGLIGYLMFTEDATIPGEIANKFFIGSLIMGYFVAVDNALITERRCYFERRFIFAKEIEPYSLTKRLRIFVVATILITVLAVYYSAHAVLYQLTQHQDMSQSLLKGIFIYDISIITLLVISFSMRVAYSFAQNQKYLLDNQLKVLQRVREGDLESFVPIMSKDEFALIAQQTNKMIEELREKQRVSQILERIVSPNIMQKLLGGDSKMLKQGQEYEVAILFCDLRRFTNYVENTPPDQVIRFLNAFFSKIADLIAAHNGIINKFMGDAILAVFGVEEEANAAKNAVQAAWHIISHTKTINLGDGNSFEMGVGIHMGRAVAGTIGSADRYEYTFIGDVVNTASRLDGLSKRLGYRIIVSDKVFEALPEEESIRFVDQGEQRVRGKLEPVHVYAAISDFEVHNL